MNIDEIKILLLKIDDKIYHLYHNRVRAHHLANVSLCVWSLSVFLPVIISYSGRKIYGYEALYSGWVCIIFNFNFAWIANIFYIYSVFELIEGSVPVKSICIAVILSIDTLRLDKFFLNEGGATSLVYGYGYGAVVWFVAMLIMLVAVGIRIDECRENKDVYSKYRLFMPICVVFCFTMMGFVLCCFVVDRFKANSEEMVRLRTVAVKRGSICSTDVEMKFSPIAFQGGPVAIIVEGEVSCARHPFLSMPALFKFGISSIRVGDRDYSPEIHLDGGIFSSISASGEAVAKLYIRESPRHDIHAVLVESAGNRTVFDQTWVRENVPPDFDYYCPGYYRFSNKNEMPQKLLIQALNLQNSTSNYDANSRDDVVLVKDVVVERRKLPIGVAQCQHFERNEEFSNKSSVGNNCSCGIYVGDSILEKKMDIREGFQIGDKIFYIPNSHYKYMLCGDEYAYVYKMNAYGQGFVIQKRENGSFRKKWTISVFLKDVADRYRCGSLQSVTEDGSNIDFIFTDKKDGGEIVYHVNVRNLIE